MIAYPPDQAMLAIMYLTLGDAAAGLGTAVGKWSVGQTTRKVRELACVVCSSRMYVVDKIQPTCMAPQVQAGNIIRVLHCQPAAAAAANILYPWPVFTPDQLAGFACINCVLNGDVCVWHTQLEGTFGFAAISFLMGCVLIDGVGSTGTHIWLAALAAVGAAFAELWAEVIKFDDNLFVPVVGGFALHYLIHVLVIPGHPSMRSKLLLLMGDYLPLLQGGSGR